jgi:hypothetical protein
MGTLPPTPPPTGIAHRAADNAAPAAPGTLSLAVGVAAVVPVFSATYVPVSPEGVHGRVSARHVMPHPPPQPQCNDACTRVFDALACSPTPTSGCSLSPTLTLTPPVLAGILGGAITDWTDPALLGLNPGLAGAAGNATGVVVVLCEGDAAVEAAVRAVSTPSLQCPHSGVHPAPGLALWVRAHPRVPCSVPRPTTVTVPPLLQLMEFLGRQTGVRGLAEGAAWRQAAGHVVRVSRPEHVELLVMASGHAIGFVAAGVYSGAQPAAALDMGACMHSAPAVVVWLWLAVQPMWCVLPCGGGGGVCVLVCPFAVYGRLTLHLAPPPRV